MSGEWLYRRLLRLYPGSFRAAFADEMEAYFKARHTAAAAGGTASLIGFWLRTAVDLAGSLWREWTSRVAFDPPDVTLRRLLHETAEAWTSLRRRPAASAMIVGLLALAIAAATSVFSVVNAVLLRPLPFPNPDRVVAVWETRPDRRIDRNPVSGHEFPLWAERSHAFERMAAMTSATVTLTGTGDPVSLAGARVTSGFCDVTGVQPALGRGFQPEDDQPGHGQVVVISHSLWQDRFASDRTVLGRVIRLDDRPFTVIGVMPEGFRFPKAQAHTASDLWMPIAEPIRLYRGRHFLNVIARLRPTLTIERANQDMTLVAAAMSRELPDLNSGHLVRVVPLQIDMVRESRASLWLLFGAVAGLVLIGCCNVAGLLAARGVARRSEMATRLALGASRWSVMRQLVAEGLLLAGAACVFGTIAASWFAGAAPALVPADVVALDGVPIDLRVLAFCIAAGLLTGLLFGMAPALQLRHVDLSTTMKGGTRGITGAGRLHRGLVIGQVALTVMLVCAAGLMARGLTKLQAVDPGFSTTGLLAVDVGLPGARYPGAVRQRQFFSDAIERLRALPGVTSVAASNMVPLGGSYSGIGISIPGRPDPKPGEELSARVRVVSAEYFATMRVPVRTGRVFTVSDRRVAVPLIRWFPQQPQPAGADVPQARPVAVINEQMAKTFWPGEDPIGREFSVLSSPPVAVIGIVADTRDESLTTAPRPGFFLQDLQEPQGQMTLLVRGDRDPASLAPGVRAAIAALDPDLAIASLTPLETVRGRVFSRPRFASWLLGAFGFFALLLMAVGLCGLMTFTTSQQLPEIGVRAALGADRRTLVRMVLRQALGLTAAGVAAGTAGAIALGYVLASEFFGVEPIDSVTWGVVTAVVCAVGLAACLSPARTAARVDPAALLRQG